MPDTKISAENAASTLDGTELTEGVQSSANVKITTAQIKTWVQTGTTTNDNAASGAKGEYQESEVLVASEVSLSSATAADVTSLSLTAGDWDIEGNVVFDWASITTVSGNGIIAWISTTSATVPTAPNKGAYHSLRLPALAAVTSATAFTLPTGKRRLSLASTTTVYLSAWQSWNSGTSVKAYGLLEARRVR